MKTTQTQHTLSARSIFVMLLLMVSMSTILGQSFTPVDYNFTHIPHANYQGIDEANPGNGEVFVWTSANGYGQWTVSSKGNWCLMSNRLGDFNQTSTPPSPNGMVAHGTLGFVDPTQDQSLSRDIKVTANLLGDVRYVWPNAAGSPARASFVIKGFSEASRGGNPPIDISFVGIPKGQYARNIIKNADNGFTTIQPFGSAPTVSSPVVSIGNGIGMEENWKDCFDVACDGFFLYITWECYNTTSGKYEVYATAVGIADGITASGFPIQIDNEGRRSTIACDVRNNTGATTLTAQAIFDVAYISAVPAYGQSVGGVVKHCAVANSIKNAPVTQPMNYTVNPTTPIYANPLHVRMLVSSAVGASAPVKAIYVLADHGATVGLAGNIFFHKITGLNIAAQQAYHIDGNLTNQHPAPLASGGTAYYEIYDEPLAGIANPYDGNPSGTNYDEFHCLYLSNVITDPSSLANALHIVRGQNAGTRRILNIQTTDNGQTWTTIPGFYIPEIGSGCVSVNQMGIHAQWYGEMPGSPALLWMMYNRDKRSFNEPIEENTLVSDTCYVRHGSIPYGSSGEAGATLLPGKMMTLWSDLHYRVDQGFNGNYVNVFGNPPYSNPIREHFAKLYFVGEVHLNIGDGSSEHLPSILTMLPNTRVIFSDNNTTQELAIKNKSKCEFYGLARESVYGSHSDFTNFWGKGKLSVTATGDQTQLNVHGGALLQVTDYLTLDISGMWSELNFLYEQNIVPPYTSTNPNIEDQTTHLNLPASGKMKVNGTVILNDANVISQEYLYDPKDIITVTSTYAATSMNLPAEQWTAQNTGFLGEWYSGGGTNCCAGNMRIRFENGTTGNNYRKALFDDCYFYGAALSAINPTSDFTVTGSQFQRMGITPIEMKRQGTFPNYSNILIQGNEFWVGDPYGAMDPVGQGVYLQGFYAKRSTSFDKVSILNNLFGNIHSLTVQDDETKAAINLQNTSALVKGNIISDFPNGIINQYIETGSMPDNSNTFICSNTISECAFNGITTKKWGGHARLNNVSYCHVGHKSEAGDLGGITHSRYHHNDIGLYLADPSCLMDLSGLHSGTGNLPAFDTIDHNNSSGSVTNAQIVINGSTLILGTESTVPQDLDEFGQNAIISYQEGENLILNEATNNVFLGTSNYKNFSCGLNHSFWGFGPDMSSLTALTNETSLSSVLQSVTFLPAATPDLALRTTVPGWSGTTPVCGASYDWGAKEKKEPPLILLYDSSTCRFLAGRGWLTYASEWWEIAYDTLRLYVDSCSHPDGNTEWAFRLLGDAVYMMDYKGDQRWVEFREWLKKVLYLDTAEDYWCSDVDQLSTTFTYFEGRGKELLGILSYLKYIKDSTTKCRDWEMMTTFDLNYQATYDYAIALWRDTVTDSIATPFDSTLPSLDDLDLGILRGNPNQGGVPVVAERRIGELIAMRNPFAETLELRYTLDKSAMTRVDVFDVLGKSVHSIGQGFQTNGEHRISIDTKQWTQGTYYVRLSTPSGDVKTVKVIKE